MDSNSELSKPALSVNPELRKQVIADFLASKGFKPKQRAVLTEHQKICLESVTIWDKVQREVMTPLLIALKSPMDYNSAGTQMLFVDAFTRNFSSFSKDELIALVSIMHAEQLEAHCATMVKQANIGEYAKKITDAKGGKVI